MVGGGWSQGSGEERDHKPVIYSWLVSRSGRTGGHRSQNGGEHGQPIDARRGATTTTTNHTNTPSVHSIL